MTRKYGFGLRMAAAALLASAPAWAALPPRADGPVGQHGAVGKGPSYLGIDVRDINGDEVVVLKLKDTHGAEITRVDHDGPAGKMGLRERDVVTQMNGVLIEGEKQMRRLMLDTPPGRTVVLVVNRDGQLLTMTAQMADRSEVERQAWEQHLSAPAFQASGPPVAAGGGPDSEGDAAGGVGGSSSGPAAGSRYSKSFLGSLLTSASYTGATFERMGPQLGSFFGVANGTGLLVRSVEDNSPAAMAGIKAGDVVVRANSRTVKVMADWVKTIRDAKGRPVTVVIVRDRQEKTLTLTPDGKRHSLLEVPGLGGSEDGPASRLGDGMVVAKVTRLREL